MPDTIYPNEETKLPSLGIWGRMRLDYLKDHHPALYADLKLSGELYAHCYETELCANNRKEFMMKQALAKNPVSEDLKNTAPLRWVGHMNALKHQVEEVIRTELIYE